MNSLGIAILELKRLSRNRFARVATIVVCLMPLLYSFLYLDAFWDPYHNLESMRVAIVNQDQAANKDNQTVRAGEELVNKLKADHTVGWRFTNESDAKQGLSNGYYELAVVIPTDFSQTILDSTQDPVSGAEIKKAQLLYYSNPSNNFLAEQIGNKLTAELQGEVNGQIAGKFFNNVFGNLSDMRDNLQTASNGAAQLQDGLSQVTDGSHKLTGYLKEAATGSGSLTSGLTSLSIGANSLSQGYTSLANGTNALGAVTDKVSNGLGQILTGSTQLTVGSSTLVKGLTQAGDQLQSVSMGANQLNAGSQSALSASAALLSGMKDLNSGATQLQDGSSQLNKSLDQMKVQLDNQTQGIPALVAGADQVSKGTAQLQTEVATTKDTLSAASQTLSALLTDPQLTESQKLKLRGTLQQIQGAQVLLSASGEVSPGIYSISTNLGALNQGAASLSGGLQMLHTQTDAGLTQLLDGSQHLASGSASLAGGLNQATEGATRLAQGLQTLSDGNKQLAAGLSSGAKDFPALVDGGKTLHTGQTQLEQGLNQFLAFSGKLSELNKGVAQLQSGSQTLASGATQAAAGAQKINAGVNALYDGSQTLTTGLDKLNTGGQELSIGLKDGVKQLSKELPQDPSKVATAMGSPVTVEQTQIHPVSNYGTGFTPYFIPLALWVGSLILFFLINVKENRLTTSGVSRLSIVLGKFWTLAFLGAFQAVISSFALIAALGLHPSHTLAFYGFNILLSWTFIAIIQLLVQAFGMAGRFLAIVLLMLQLTSCGGTFPMELVPKFFQVISPFLPMTYGTAGLRQIISGSASISLSFSVFMLLAFAVGSIVLTLLISSNWVKVRDLHPAQELAA